MEGTLLLIAAVCVAAFGGPLWAVLVLAVFAAGVIFAQQAP